jgi:AcrR family transcriptional regulator
MTTYVVPEAGDVTVAGSGAPKVDASPLDAGPVDASLVADAGSAEAGLVEAGPLDAGAVGFGDDRPVGSGIALAVAGGALVDVCGDRRAPGRPRSARADEAIIEAVLDLLAEGSNIETLSIEAVATRAAVGKATIYRRWPNKEALIVHALAALKGPMPEIVGESIREDLLALLRPIGAASSTRAGRIMPCLIPEVQRNPEMAARYRQLTEPRRELMRSVLRRGISTGELRADIDIDATVAMLTGPMVAQTMLMSYPSVDLAKLPEQIVDTMLPGLRMPASE